MPAVTFTSREFNQETSRAKKAADAGPIFITDRGRPSYFLMTIAAYERLAQPPGSIVDLLAMPEAVDFDFDPPRLCGPLFRPADLS